MRRVRESGVNGLSAIVSGTYVRRFPSTETMRSLVLRLCGDAVLCTADRVPITPSLGAKTLGLIAFLALEPGPHGIEQCELAVGELPLGVDHLEEPEGSDMARHPHLDR